MDQTAGLYYTFGGDVVAPCSAAVDLYVVENYRVTKNDISKIRRVS